jgi:hypothetical protein
LREKAGDVKGKGLGTIIEKPDQRIEREEGLRCTIGESEVEEGIKEDNSSETGRIIAFQKRGDDRIEAERGNTVPVGWCQTRECKVVKK